MAIPSDSDLADVFGGAVSGIKKYVDILSGRGIDWGLLGPRERDRIWDRHVLNSAALASVVPQDAYVIDVGSGAGLPGIPLALARPDLIITLLEPLQRRSRFLEHAVDELRLSDRVRVVRERAEDHDETYDVVTCRAVAKLDKLLDWTTPLFADGELLALKGESAQVELDAAGASLVRRGMQGQVLTVRATQESEPTYVIRVRPGAGRD